MLNSMNSAHTRSDGRNAPPSQWGVAGEWPPLPDDDRPTQQMTVIVNENDDEEVHDEELPPTEQIIEELQNDDRDPLHDANDIHIIENDDIEIDHYACDGRVILRYELRMGWEMDGERGEMDGRILSDEEVQEMTLNVIPGVDDE